VVKSLRIGGRACCGTSPFAPSRRGLDQHGLVLQGQQFAPALRQGGGRHRLGLKAEVSVESLFQLAQVLWRPHPCQFRGSTRGFEQRLHPESLALPEEVLSAIPR
jgi:hypothetical protein